MLICYLIIVPDRRTGVFTAFCFEPRSSLACIFVFRIVVAVSAHFVAFNDKVVQLALFIVSLLRSAQANVSFGSGVADIAVRLVSSVFLFFF